MTQGQRKNYYNDEYRGYQRVFTACKDNYLSGVSEKIKHDKKMKLLNTKMHYLKFMTFLFLFSKISIRPTKKKISFLISALKSSTNNRKLSVNSIFSCSQ